MRLSSGGCRVEACADCVPRIIFAEDLVEFVDFFRQRFLLAEFFSINYLPP